ncbi:IclR family transcriptional regulator [Simiduia litorea]|uniref:IclR family transcriptional regulator n=1 Tax=Simiduia litorea TaxID=1435348 RepID=UPI0036F37AA6
MAEKIAKYAVPALDKGLDILEFLAGDRLPRSQADIAAGIGKTPNEIYRVLIGLEARGYLVRDEISGKYRSSLKLLGLGRSLAPVALLRQAALPLMEDLASRLGQSCHLSMIHQNQLMVVVQVPSPGAVSLSIAEGTHFPLLPTASGRLLLGYSPETQRRELLASLADADQQCVTERSLLALREQGYELSQSRLTEGVSDCAAIVGAPDGQVVAALAVSCLTSVMDKRLERSELVAAVTEAAQAISARLGLSVS